MGYPDRYVTYHRCSGTTRTKARPPAPALLFGSAPRSCPLVVELQPNKSCKIQSDICRGNASPCKIICHQLDKHLSVKFPSVAFTLARRRVIAGIGFKHAFQGSSATGDMVQRRPHAVPRRCQRLGGANCVAKQQRSRRVESSLAWCGGSPLGRYQRHQSGLYVNHQQVYAVGLIARRMSPLLYP